MHSENRFDFLRILAAWSILLFHAYPLAGSTEADFFTRYWKQDTLGGFAVSIFFIISGYLVTISLQRSNNAAVFLKKRFLRIYPALAVVIVLSFLVVGPLFTSLSLGDYFSSSYSWKYLKTITGFRIVFDLPGVFTENKLSAVNGSLWSLSLELKAYLGLLAVWLLPLRFKHAMVITAVYLTIAYAYRPVEYYGQAEKYLGLDYFNSKYMLLFSLGGLIATFREGISRALWHYLGLTALLTILYLQLQEVSRFSSTIYHLSLPILILWAAQFWTFLPKIHNRLGDLSYGIYLYSFPIQQIILSLSNNSISISSFILISTAGTLIMAFCSWHFIEKHAMKKH